jgi:hypothetical protein
MSTLPQLNSNARASAVNRTHRVVREQALTLRAQRSESRGLMVPLGISSALLVVVCYAVWAVMDNYEATPSGVPDASDQLLVMLLWFLPVTVVVLGIVWLRRTRVGSHEVSQ